MDESSTLATETLTFVKGIQCPYQVPIRSVSASVSEAEYSAVTSPFFRRLTSSDNFVNAKASDRVRNRALGGWILNNRADQGKDASQEQS